VEKTGKWKGKTAIRIKIDDSNRLSSSSIGMSDRSEDLTPISFGLDIGSLRKVDK
jgi:hypothetical protein